MKRIQAALQQCDYCVAIGTSGNVYPAAGFVQETQPYRCKTLEINLEPSKVKSHFDEVRIGKAGTLVPEWVDELLTKIIES